MANKHEHIGYEYLLLKASVGHKDLQNRMNELARVGYVFIGTIGQGKLHDLVVLQRPVTELPEKG